VRRYRRAAGLTQEELAERASLSARAISDLERGLKYRPRRDTVQLLADALELEGLERETFQAAARRAGGLEQTGAIRVLDLPVGGFLGAVPDGPIVAREREIARVREMVAAVGGGQGRLLLLAGEPGVGKTRLAQEIMPELPMDVPSLQPGQERRLVFAAVSRFLGNVAGPGGTLLLLDDLQWASADALDLLTALVRSAPESPLRVVGAYRDTEVEPDDPLSVMLADLAHAHLMTRLPIGPIAPEAAVQLLDELLPDLPRTETERRVLARAGGVPFFLVSCAQDLRSGSLASGGGGQPSPRTP
jgi:transcriptional regulator with XRE-family HTH domain